MLKITNLYKTFNPGTVNENKVLNGLNLELAEGDFVTVIGGNGAGKSTTLNAIAGNIRPDFGTIVLDGRTLPICPTIRGQSSSEESFRIPEWELHPIWKLPKTSPLPQGAE